MDAAELHSVARAIRAGRPIADRAFDRVYAEHMRLLSAKHWTPVAVAARAATLLVEGGASSVLDVGAGVGKFCIVGALVTGASFTGLEERRDRLDGARRAAAAFELSRIRWVLGRIERLAFEPFDGFYFFNPFAEALEPDPTGAPAQRGAARYRRDVARTQAALAAARRGARVVTYHGLGGALPPGYRLVTREAMVTGPLECWEKVEAPRTACRSAA